MASELSARSVLNAGDKMYNEEMLVSDNLKYFLKFEKSGDLVLYEKASLDKKWSTETAGTASRLAFMQPDGNFALYNASRPTWHTDTASSYNHYFYYLKLDDDGRLGVWDTRTNNLMWSSFYGKHYWGRV
ncbi:uncharacterized protein [Chironomus tepperi]|uniref:uncharacterized protein n=1 Tax=Chironomus tepperi TaxID=113505 RepID=UPI00391F8741